MVTKKSKLGSKRKWTVPLFNERLKALDLLKENGYRIAIADACPRPWLPMRFYVAVGVKDISEAERLGFHEGTTREIEQFLD
jgi:hypothetical protein